MSSIELKQVAKSWGNTTALHSVDLQIAPGSFCVLLGPSGCGKSTTLRIIAETLNLNIEHPTPDRYLLSAAQKQ